MQSNENTSTTELVVHLLTAYTKVKPDHDNGLCYWLKHAYNEAKSLPYYSESIAHPLINLARNTYLRKYGDPSHNSYVANREGYCVVRHQLALDLIKLLTEGKIWYNPIAQKWFSKKKPLV